MKIKCGKGRGKKASRIKLSKRRKAMMRGEGKKEQMVALFGGKAPDVMFVLSGNIIPRMVKNRERGYRSPSYTGTDIHGLVNGAKARVIACAEAHRCFPEAQIVTTSYTRGKTHEMPTDAWVMMEEMERFGVDTRMVILEEKSDNGISELKEMAKLAAVYGWERVAVITSEYHVPRISEMWNRIETFMKPTDRDFQDMELALGFMANAGVEVVFVSAESILLLRSHLYAPFIKKVKETSGYQKRLAAEAKGLSDLLEGQYGK